MATTPFALAVASLLAPGSVIHAIDKDERSLSQIPDRYQDVTIRKEVVDLGKSDLSLPALNGMPIANFLHFIKHQGDFIARLRTLSERLLVAEYDGRPPSPWVPYPLGLSALRALLLERGFSEIATLGTRASDSAANCIQLLQNGKTNMGQYTKRQTPYAKPSLQKPVAC